MWTLESEQTLREYLIEKIISKANEGDGMLSRGELKKNFEENCISTAVLKTGVMDYKDFLKERRALMVMKMERYFQSLGEAEMETE